MGIFSSLGLFSRKASGRKELQKSGGKAGKDRKLRPRALRLEKFESRELLSIGAGVDDQTILSWSAAPGLGQTLPTLPVGQLPYAGTGRQWVDFNLADGLNPGAVPQVQIVSASQSQLTAQVVLAGAWLDQTTVAGRVFSALTLPGYGSAGALGKPEMPAIRAMFEAPLGAQITATVSGSPKQFNLAQVGIREPIVPVQPPVVKVPGARESAPLVQDGGTYATDAFVAQAGVRVVEAGMFAGRRLVMVEVLPAAYNPVKGVVAVYDTLNFTLQFSGGQWSQSVLTTKEQAHLAQLVLNASSGTQGQPQTQQTKQPGNLLIIVHRDFAGQIGSFVTHKESLGWTVQVVDTARAGTTATAIRSFIQSQYANPATRPDAVLLIGDTDRIPTFVGQAMVYGDTAPPNTDLYYACMDPGDDWFPEFPVGRISVADGAQLRDVLQKIITYESSSPAGWTSRAAFMAGVDNYTITEGTHEWVITTHMDPLGFTSDRLYVVSQGATTQDVIDAINQGRLWAVYSGHGIETAWTDGPPLTAADVMALTNNGMYPVVASFACLTGNFAYPEAFLETWLRISDRGAVAAFGSSVTSFWDEDDILQKRLFDAIYGENQFHVGTAIYRAKELYQIHFGPTTTTRRYFEQYNLLGDPTVRLLAPGEDVGPVGPELVAIIPNEGQILDIDQFYTLNVAPRDLLLRFNEGQQLDPATLGAILFVRSVDGTFGNGNDQLVPVGYVGLADRPNEVIVRFAGRLEDDLYRLIIVGRDDYVDVNGNPVAPLRNTLGIPFRAGMDPEEQVLEYEFELDLGPLVTAVVPQPVIRGPQITVQSLPVDGDFFAVNDGTQQVFFEFVNTANGNGVAAGRVAVPFHPTNTPAVVAASIQEAIQSQISGGALRGLRGVNVAGAVVTIDGPRALVQTGSAALRVQHLRQLRDVIEVYFNKDDLADTPQAAENRNFYQLFVTRNSADPNDDLMVLPQRVEYDAALDKATLYFAQDLALYGTGAFRLRVGNAYQPTLSDFRVVTTDPGTTFWTALDIRSVGGSLAPIFGNGSGPQSLILTGTIDAHPLDFTLEWPGAVDEPGHRDLPNHPALMIEDHFSGESAPDQTAGVTTIPYYFPEAGWNLITEAQKQRAREIFTLFGYYLGVQFYENPRGGLAIVTGDLALAGLQSAPGGVAGVATGGGAIMDYAENWGASEYGGAWFLVAMHEIGHLLGYGHAYDQLAIMGSGETLTFLPLEPVFPYDHDLIHGQHMHRPDSIDIDMYRVQLDERGLFSVEILAERGPHSSLLDAVVTLYQEYTENGIKKYRVLARNDDYYSDDPALEMYLQPGVYYVGVTAKGNTQYDPNIYDTGVGGVSQGDYQLRLTFKPRGVDPNNPETFKDVSPTPWHLVDSTGTLLDGDADGVPGGVYNFWFNVQPESRTVFVDKLSPVPGSQQDGSLRAPYSTISAALAAVAPGSVLRIVGNNFDNDDPSVPASLRDNVPYEIGYNLFGAPLADGPRFEVPRGVTVMIDAGAVFKLSKANIDVGSSSEGVDRSGSALQVLGTPYNKVYFTSYFDETLGRDGDPLMKTIPRKGDWGGLVIRNNLDYDFIETYNPASGLPAREVLETQGIFLNYINQADIRFGGGEVIVDGVRGVYAPICLFEARPTITFNTITNSADAAISADPNSFADTKIQNWDRTRPFMADYDRVGPQLRYNQLAASYAVSTDVGAPVQAHSNTVNGILVRVRTAAGERTEVLEIAARFDDWDIVHVIPENLVIRGTPGGPIVSPQTTNLQRIDDFRLQVPLGGGDAIRDGETFSIFDGSTRVVFEFNLRSDWMNRGTGSFIPGRVEIRYDRSNDPNPGDPPSTQSQLAGLIVNAINWARDNRGLDVTAVHLGGGLIELRSTAPVWKLEGFGTWDARIDARLQIDPGLVVKLGGSRIEVGMGAQLIAEGRPGLNETAPSYKVILTSLLDTRYGAGGTFDTVSQTGGRAATPGDWGGIYFAPASSGSIDQAVIAYGGGNTAIEGGFARFSPVEIYQAEVRVVGTRFEFNDAVAVAGTRGGRGTLSSPATIFVRGAQPIIVANDFLGNRGFVISIDAGALKAWNVPDWGRSTGPLSSYEEYADNFGPMVRKNRFGLVDNLSLSNQFSGMEVRGGQLTTESIWDDTDIVHILRNEIIISNYHHVGGLRLQSNAAGSLVVKLTGSNAGFTATGQTGEMDDRIGGILQIVGMPGRPVILTDLADDSVGAGFDILGRPVFDTNGNGPSEGSPGAWRSVRFDRYAHDRNVAVVLEHEPGSGVAVDQNANPLLSQRLGVLAPEEKAGDDIQRLGFQIVGFIRFDDPGDVDVYQFDARAGTEIWVDIDWSSFALDTIVELVTVDGQVLAWSDNSHEYGRYEHKTDPDGALLGLAMDRDVYLRHDFYTMNPRDAGFRVVLPGPAGQVRTYYLRVRSTLGIGNIVPGSQITEGQQFRITDQNGTSILFEFDRDGVYAAGAIPVAYQGLNNSQVAQAIVDAVTTARLTRGLQVSARIRVDQVLQNGVYVATPHVMLDGVRARFEPETTPFVRLANTAGKYQLQVRLREMQELAGCTVEYADIRYATNGIEIRGFPQHSPLLGESAEIPGDNQSFGNAQELGNLLSSERNAISVVGYLSGRTDVDWYRIEIDYEGIQSIGGINDGGSVWSTIFDIDYADGMARPDLSMWVFDSAGRLIYFGTNSSVVDDLALPQGPSLEDLARGSIWSRDPYIGPVYLAERNEVYYVAITSVLATPRVLSSVLGGDWCEDKTAYPLVRVEPINAIARVVEEHVESGPRSFVSAFNPNADPNPSSSPDGNQRLSLVPDEFMLGDVVFYVLTGTDLYTVDPFTGAVETDVTDWADPYLPGSPSIYYRDIAMRNDGRLMTVSIGPGANFNPRYREFDLGNANTLVIDVDTGIDVIRRDPANPASLQADPNNSVYVQALVHDFRNTGDRGRHVLIVGYIPNPDLGGTGATSGENLVWLLSSGGTAVNHPLINNGQRTSGNRLFSNIVPIGQLFTAPTILANPATQTEAPYGSPGVQELDFEDGDWFSVTSAGGTTQEFEFDLGIDVRMDVQGAAAFRDGQFFSIRNVNNGVTYTFEFDSGPVIVVPATATAALDGVYVVIPGTAPGGGNVDIIFEFDRDGNLTNSSHVRVPFTTGAPGSVLAQNLVAAINAQTSFTVVATAVGRRVSLVNDRTDNTHASSDTAQVQIEGSHGVSGFRTRIAFEESWSSQQLGLEIERVVDASQTFVFPPANRIDASYAYRTPGGSPPSSPGDRLSFFNADTFTRGGGVPLYYVEGSPGVTPGRQVVRFGAGYTGSEMAQVVASAINASGIGVSASASGYTVVLSGVAGTNPVNLSGAPNLSFTGEGGGGRITGLAYLRVPGFVSGQEYVLFAVSDQGGLFYVTGEQSAYANGGSWGFIPIDPQGAPPYFARNPGAGPQLRYITQVRDPQGNPISFSGLSAGPANVEFGGYAQTLFASDSSGRVWAMDILGNLLGVFANGSTNIDPPSPVGAVHGVAFSPIDYNLWHWTLRRRDDAGHGIYSTLDTSRVSAEGYDPLMEGLRSYYFGLDDPTDAWGNQSQPGASNFTSGEGSDGSRLMTYNLPGGAIGSLTTGTFSLKGYTAADRPMLYFTYYAHTENSNDFDGLRVYVSNDGANWTLIATNTDLNDPGFIRDGIEQPGYGGYIREIHDLGGNWRQARIDLSQFAGLDKLRIRFDFSTASDMDVGDPQTGGSYLVAPAAAQLRDGQTFVLGNSSLNIADVTFEIDMGYALVFPNAAGVQIKESPTTGLGEYVDIGDGGSTIRFEFDKDGRVGPAVPGISRVVPVRITDAMTTRQVADLLAAAINAERTAGRLAVQAFVPEDAIFQGSAGNRVFLIGAQSVARGTHYTGAPIALAVEGSAPGQYTAGRTPVYLRPDMTQLEVSRVITATVNRRFRVVPDQIYIRPLTTAASLNNTVFTITGLDGGNVPRYAVFGFTTVLSAPQIVPPSSLPALPPGVRVDYAVLVGLQGATTPAAIASRIAAAINLLRTSVGFQVTAASTPEGLVQLSGPQTAFDGLNLVSPTNSPLRASDLNQTTIKLDERLSDTRRQVEPLMRVFQVRASDPGPLYYSETLQGDSPDKSFGTTARNNNRFFDYRRGQNNNFEGWYIDDIVIGFAERGEMVTNAPAGVTDFDFLRAPLITDPIVITGSYQLEIRRGDEFGVLLTPPDSPYKVLRLTGSADTNDRWAQAITIRIPAAADLGHGDRFWIEDGVNRQEFVFLDQTIGGATGNALPVYFTTAQAPGTIASRVAAAINQAYSLGRLKVTALSMGTSDRVNLWGATYVGGTLGGESAVTGTKPAGPINQIVFGSVEAPTIQRVRLLMSAGFGIRHRDTFRLEDGTNAVDFIFLHYLSGETPEPGVYGIVFDFGMSAERIGALVVQAINQAYADGRLTLRASPGPVTGMVDLTAEDPQMRITVTGLQYTTFFDPVAVPGVTQFYPNPAGHPIVGDRNHFREKGQIIINGVNIMYAQGWGIRVEPAARDADGNWPFPASGRWMNAAYPTATPGAMWVPGVSLINNIVAYSGSGGIYFGGDTGQPVGAIPFGRIVNNTVVGPILAGDDPAGVGIQVGPNATPTLLNNIIAGWQIGVQVHPTSSSTVLGANTFQLNAVNTVGTTPGSFADILSATDPLFVNAARGNFYPDHGSRVIDSSLDALQERADYYSAVLQPLGIPPSPILAPTLDIFGQLRQDDPRVAPPPGLGANVFKDRGAVDRVDFFGPTAAILIPADNGPDDRNPSLNDVTLAGIRVMQFVIGLSDIGVGIDDATVVAQAVRVWRDDRTRPLQEGVDYLFSYNATNNEIYLYPAAGVWRTGYLYTVELDRNLIRDLANNPLQPNRPQPHPQFGDCYFQLNLAGIDYGDAPDAPYPSLLANNGARHLIMSGYYLGTGATTELDSSQATPDRFDDGVQFQFGGVVRVEQNPANPAERHGVNVYVSVPTTWNVGPTDTVGYLNAWIDFNRDGDWADPGEQIFANLPLNAGQNNYDFGTGKLVFTVPHTAQLGVTWARFRLSTYPFTPENALSYVGEANDGEVEDYEIELVSAYRDWGDAPASYPVTRVNNGAYHAIVGPNNPHLAFPDQNNPGRFLAAPDAEREGQATAEALGDDRAGDDDENGVRIVFISPGYVPQITVYAAAPGWLNAWIDLNVDGDWDDPGEKIVDGVWLTAGEHRLHDELVLSPIPDTIPLGYTFVRFRFSDNVRYLNPGGGNPDPLGPDPNGEVEDYRVPVIIAPEDFGDAPATYGTVVADNGARHVIVPGIHLGFVAPDLDLDGQPDPVAQGDDTDLDGDDEDGLIAYGRIVPGEPLDSRLVPGELARLVVRVTGVGYLSAWIDFNRDGQFADYIDPASGLVVREQVLAGQFISDDSAPFEFDIAVPSGLTAGPTFLRLRYSSAQYAVMSPIGPAPDGEVEDHQVRIEIGNSTIRGWKFNDRNANTRWDTQLAGIVPAIQPAPLGSGTTVLLLTNNGTYGPVSFGFNFEFYGGTYQQFYISNNGAISFGSPVATFDPAGFPQSVPMIAPFWADVDTRLAGGLVELVHGTNPFNGNPFVQVNWVNVGYFDRTNPANVPNLSKRNSFSLYIEDDPLGDVVAFIYHGLQWTTGDPQGVNGLGAPGAEIGFNAGDGANFARLMRPTTTADLNELVTRQTHGFRMDPSTGTPSGREPGLPGVVVYIDQNNNGVRDPGERWTVSRSDDPNTPQDEAGYFEFTGLFPGNYLVREELAGAWNEWVQTYPQQGVRTYRGTNVLGLVAVAPSRIADGDQFALSDGSVRVNFEFDNDFSLRDPSAVRISLTGLVNAPQVANAIVGAVNSARLTRGLNITPAAIGDLVQLTAPQIFVTPTSYPWSHRFSAPAGAQLPDGRTFAVGDGNVRVVFEFDHDGTPTNPGSGNVLVNVAGLTADQVAAAIAAAVNNAASSAGMNVWASALGSSVTLSGRTLIFEALSSGLPPGPVRINPDGSYSIQLAAAQTVSDINFGNYLRPRVQVTGARITEGNHGDLREVEITFSMTRSFGAPVDITFSTVGGTATSDDDYLLRSGALRLQAEGVPRGVWTYRPITSNEDNDYDFQISGQSIVIQAIDPAAEGGDWEIFLYDLSTETLVRVTNNTSDDRFSAVHRRGDLTYIVWVGADPVAGQRDTEIFLRVYRSGVGFLSPVIQLTNNAYDDGGPQISDAYITWWGRVTTTNTEIFAFDLIGGLNSSYQVVSAPINISNNIYSDYEPQVSGSNIVWYGFDGFDTEIFHWSPITGTSRLTSNGITDVGPRIDGSNIVWRGFDGQDYELFHYSLTTGVVTQITDNTTADNAPAISGNHLVWQGQVGGQWEILYYNLANLGTGVPPQNISANALYDAYPQISGNRVVWHTWDGNDWEVFYFEIGSGMIAQNISSNTVYDWYPQVSGDSIVWRSYDGDDYEIMVASYQEPRVTASVRVTIVGDNHREPDEYFLMRILSASIPGLGPGAAIISQPDAPIWILNDDHRGYGIDFGDAPNSYRTVVADNGARHLIDPAVYLGSRIDSEVDGQPRSDGLGDDLAGLADEDGVLFISPLIPGQRAQVVVTASVPGYLSAWIDFNRDGNWGDPNNPLNPVDLNEQIFTDQRLSAGPNVLSFTVPADAMLGTTFARFRFSTAQGLSYVGTALDGEVEDYQVTLVPTRPTGIWQRGKVVFFEGTGANDTFEFSPGSPGGRHVVVFNGTRYEYLASAVDTIVFNGAGGRDSAVLNGTSGAEEAELRPGIGVLKGSYFLVCVTDAETVTVNGRGGADTGRMYALAGTKDKFTGTSTYASLAAGIYTNRLNNFPRVQVFGNPGETSDEARLYGSAAISETFIGTPDSVVMNGGSYRIQVDSFRWNYAYGNGAGDKAELYDRPTTRDWLVADPTYARLSGSGFYIWARDFAQVFAQARGGTDGVTLYDNPSGVDTFLASPTEAVLSGSGYVIRAEGFRTVTAQSRGGNDTASLYDDPTTFDRLETTPEYAVYYGSRFNNRVFSFPNVFAYSRGGDDRARIYDNRIFQETFISYPSYSRLIGPTYQRQVEGFRYVTAYSSGGEDIALLYDSPGNDVFTGRFGESTLSGTGFQNQVMGFTWVSAYATAGGYDRATMHDLALSWAPDHLSARDNWAQVSNSLISYILWAVDFDRVDAYGSDHGVDTKEIIGVLDFLFTHGSWA